MAVFPRASSKINSSSVVSFSEESNTHKSSSELSIFPLALSIPIFSTVSSASRMPAVSAKERVTPPTDAVCSITSRVVPAISVTIAKSSPRSIL